MSRNHSCITACDFTYPCKNFGISLQRLPSDRKRNWFKVLKKVELKKNPGRSPTYICSKHFTKYDLRPRYLYVNEHTVPNFKDEMVAGCCVCSDERGWTENPLVYCDGVGCNIAVHQACYGILEVPSGNWYCRKCESQERSARVRCELCPSKDGALKRTDNGGWAHVVCGLYIPEVRFASVQTMEPIVLSQIPTERYNKVCYICEQNNRGSRASVGACMQCNKAGCKQQFHVTCAQMLGLLCEEAGNYLDNVKYCGYCQEHYMKLKKGANVKTVPPYRPLSSYNSGSDESPEKKGPNNQATDSKQIAKRKSVSGRPSLNQNGPSKSLSSDKKDSSGPPTSGTDQLNGTIATTSANTINTSQGSGKNDNSSRFTTSNFVESVITPSESVLADMQKNKKRKLNDQPLSPMSNTSNVMEAEKNLNKFNAQNDENDDDEDGTLNFIEEPNLSTLKTDSTVSAPVATTVSTNVTSVISLPSTSTLSNATTNLPTTVQSSSQNNSYTNPVSSSYLSTSFPDPKATKNDPSQLEKNRAKPKRPSNTNNASKKGKNNRESPSTNGPPVVPETVVSFASNVTAYPERSNSVLSNVSVRSESMDSCPPPTNTNKNEIKESPPTSPENSVINKSTGKEERAEREFKSFQSGISAPHMLGNQLNPTSSMAQKMSDTLNDELEAHSIFTNADSSASANSFIGPPLYNRIISTARANDASKRSSSPSNGPLASLSSSAANFPQTLEELLETQWEQGGTFLMEQAQHFDIASLLTCLHKLREENLGLEEHIRKLKARRDHLLGVNARLAMPLAPLSQPATNVHTPSQPHQQPVVSQAIPQPNTHHQQPSQHHGMQQPSHSQTYQTSASSQLSNVTDPVSIRNIPLPPSAYSSSGSIRGTHGPPVYQNAHHLENGLPQVQSHHPHSRASQQSSGAIRHHGAAGNSMYGSGQSSNPGVVVRTSNLPMQPGSDRRSGSVVSSNYQQPYHLSNMPHQQQQQMMHREDTYHSMHSKQN